MSTDKLHDLQLHALRRAQALAKANGFKRLPDEKAFMDELSGEDDGIEVIFRDRFTMLTVNERSKLTRLQHLILTRLSDDKAPRRAALI